MIKVFIDFAIDLPEHIRLKMPDIDVLTRKTHIVSDKAKEQRMDFEQLNADDYDSAFRPYLMQGNDVIYVSISSYFSKSVKIAKQTIEKLKKEFPKNSIIHIDTCNLSIASGYLAYYVYRLAEQGMLPQQIKKIIDVEKHRKYCFFIVDDLKHLKSSGKIDNNVLSGGATLNIKPILTISQKGELQKIKQVSGPKRALAELVHLMSIYGTNVADHRVGIIYSGNIQRAFDLKNSLLDQFSIENNIDIVEINKQIFAATGDGVLGLVFNGKRIR